MGRNSSVLKGGRRATRGGRPQVEIRCRGHTYFLQMPRFKAVLVWSRWQGYRLEAATVPSATGEAKVTYYTY